MTPLSRAIADAADPREPVVSLIPPEAARKIVRPFSGRLR
jgi:hypothetical protein